MIVPEAVQSGPLRIEWHALEDRIGHRIIVSLDNGDVPLLESIEAESEDAQWPLSPPLLDWHCDEREQTTVLLGVGLAGKSHWSAAITAKKVGEAPYGDPMQRPGGRLEFDIACRVGEQPRILGSSYRCLTPARQLTDSVIAFAGWRLSVDAANSRVRLVEQRLIIEPLQPAAQAWPQTLRWRYAISTSTERGAV